jgi:hypothetical protein
MLQVFLDRLTGDVTGNVDMLHVLIELSNRNCLHNHSLGRAKRQMGLV